MIKVGDSVWIKPTARGYDPEYHAQPLRVIGIYRDSNNMVVDSRNPGSRVFHLDEVMHVPHRPVPAPKPRVTKGDILDQAKVLITGNREDDYGDAAKNFSDISALWSVVMGIEVKPWQVAACMTQLKLARAIKTSTHVDSWTDMAGYVGLAGELALNGE